MQTQGKTFHKSEPKTDELIISKVPVSELNIDFVRSSGPGGQNVNKTNSKAVLKWNVGDSETYSEEQKNLIRGVAGKRLNQEDEITITSQEERKAPQNEKAGIEKLNSLIKIALTPKKKRKATKPSRHVKERRLRDKKIQSEKKKNRQVINE